MALPLGMPISLALITVLTARYYALVESAALQSSTLHSLVRAQSQSPREGVLYEPVVGILPEYIRTSLRGPRPETQVVPKHGLNEETLDTKSRYDQVRNHSYRLRDGVIYNPVMGFTYEVMQFEAGGGNGTSNTDVRESEWVTDRLRKMGVWIPGETGDETLERTVTGDVILPRLSVRQFESGVMVEGSESRFEVFFSSNTPAEARDAFEASVKIWADHFACEPTLRVDVTWQNLQAGTLGQAGSPFFILGSAPGSSQLDDNTIYSAAMAASLQGSDFLQNNEFHIIVELNSRAPWHFDLGSSAGAGTFDLVTTVIHEICHGLFFNGVLTVSGQRAVYLTGDTPGRFDRFLSLPNRASVSSCAEGVSLFGAVTNDRLRFVDSDSVGTDFGLFSPTTYQAGSSIYHLDPDTLQADCSLNSISLSPELCSDLMTESITDAYTQRNLGENLLRIMRSVRGESDGLPVGTCEFGQTDSTSDETPVTPSESGINLPSLSRVPVWVIAFISSLIAVLLMVGCGLVWYCCSGKKKKTVSEG